MKRFDPGLSENSPGRPVSEIVKHKDKLLQQLADKLQQYAQFKVQTLEVVLRECNGDDGFVFTVPQFLDYLVNDVTWDERGNWSEATLLELRVI